MHHKVLIVGTSPYDTQGPARAFETYFSNWERENLIQIFTSPINPIAGHCKELFRITDGQMLKRWFKSDEKIGETFKYEDLLQDGIKEHAISSSKSLLSKLYKIGSKKNALIYLLRNILWKEKYWCTSELQNWVDLFRPECVFLAFSDDFFILKIALYFAKRYNIPIVSCIGDDYYFNDRDSISPLYRYYRKKYKKLVDEVLGHGGSAAYIGNKIRDKYNDYFHLNGETVYLTSKIVAHDFKPINLKQPIFVYCGNIRLGRNDSLNEIGYALQKINSNYKLRVFSNEKDESFYQELIDNPGIIYGGSITYDQVVFEMEHADVLVIVEGFEKENVNITRYSLSTKVADSLATGGAVFAYGFHDCGAIEYAESTGCIATCTNKDELYSQLSSFLTDIDLQRTNYDKAREVVECNHTLENSNRIFEAIVQKSVDNYKYAEDRI